MLLEFFEQLLVHLSDSSKHFMLANTTSQYLTGKIMAVVFVWGPVGQEYKNTIKKYLVGTYPYLNSLDIVLSTWFLLRLSHESHPTCHLLIEDVVRPDTLSY